MSTKISAFVSENFDVKTASKGLPAGTYRVVITFKIDREGHITNIRSRGPNKTLETEAIKAIKGMPQMIPGQQRGKNVGVLYALPLTFNLDPKDTDQNKGG